jgi:hypothetical protein
MKINLFDPWKIPVYGTASAIDVVAVVGAAVAYCLVLSVVTASIVCNIMY